MLIGGVALHLITDAMIVYLLLIIGGGLLVALSTIFQIQMLTYLQILTPKDLIGKVISCFICVCMCAIPLGQFIYGMIFDDIKSGVYLPFYATALIAVIIGISTRRLFYEIDRSKISPNRSVS